MQFDLGSSFASLGLPNMASLSMFGSSVGSSSLLSCFSTSASSNQSSSTHGPHVPCDLVNASTLGASGFTESNTLGATSSIELQGTLGVVSSIELQGTLYATNFASLCNSSGRGASSIQGLVYGT